MPEHGWARVRSAGAHNLRRGAWYRVVNDSGPKFVILDVVKNNVPVPREALDFADQKPSQWTIVRFDPNRPIPPRISQQKLPLTYAVCPNCRERSKVEDDDKNLICHECGLQGAVDWDHPC